MIEQGFNYTDSTIKEMTDLFEIRVETWSQWKKRKNRLQLSRNLSTKLRRGKGKTPTPVS